MDIEVSMKNGPMIPVRPRSGLDQRQISLSQVARNVPKLSSGKLRIVQALKEFLDLN